MPSTAVLIHGCHLQAKGWERIIWGDLEKGLPGRVPKGILEARKPRWDADTIIFSTGASIKDGLKEGEYIYNFTMRHLDELAEFLKVDQTSLEQYIEQRKVLELTSQNTITEVIASSRIARERGCDTILLESSNTHILRCLKDAMSVYEKNEDVRFFLDNMYATPSRTGYDGASVDDVIIFEPPHRGDQPKWQTYRYARAIFQVLRQGDARFEQFLRAFGELLKTYGVTVDWDPRA